MKQKEQNALILNLQDEYEKVFEGDTCAPRPFKMRFSLRTCSVEVCSCGAVHQFASYWGYNPKCPNCGAEQTVVMETNPDLETGIVQFEGTKVLGINRHFKMIDATKKLSAFASTESYQRIRCSTTAKSLIEDQMEAVVAASKNTEVVKQATTVTEIVLVDNDKFVDYCPATNGKSQFHRKGLNFMINVRSLIDHAGNEVNEEFESVYGQKPAMWFESIQNSAEIQRLKRAEEKKTKENSLMDLFPAIPDLWEHANSLIIDLSPVYGARHDVCVCNRCNVQFDIAEAAETTNLDAVCPHCGAAIRINGSTIPRDHLEAEARSSCGITESTSLAHWSALSDGTLGLQVVTYSVGMQDNGGIAKSTREIVRIRFSKAGSEYYEAIRGYDEPEDRWEKDGNTKASIRYPHSYSRSYMTQDLDKIITEVEKTDLAKTGLKEAMKIFASEDAEDAFAWRVRLYTEVYKTCPAIELVAKSGLNAVLLDVLTQFSYGNEAALNMMRKRIEQGASTPAQILGVSKWAFKKAREHKLGFEALNMLGAMQDVDPSATWDDFVAMQDETLLNNYRWREICRAYKIPVKKVLAYLEQVYMYQCIEKADALMIWGDYLNIAKTLSFDLKDKTRLYPTSLKKAHDVANFAYKKIADQNTQKQFNDVCVSFSGLAYKGEKMSVVIPRAAEDLTREGSTLKHCVRSYVERIASGRTFVCFIRNNDDLDTPFYTVEVNNGSVVQVRGYCNRRPTREVRDFVTEWAWAKQLVCNY